MSTDTIKMIQDIYFKMILSFSSGLVSPALKALFAISVS